MTVKHNHKGRYKTSPRNATAGEIDKNNHST